MTRADGHSPCQMSKDLPPLTRLLVILPKFLTTWTDYKTFSWSMQKTVASSVYARKLTCDDCKENPQIRSFSVSYWSVQSFYINTKSEWTGRAALTHGTLKVCGGPKWPLAWYRSSVSPRPWFNDYRCNIGVLQYVADIMCDQIKSFLQIELEYRNTKLQSITAYKYWSHRVDVCGSSSAANL